MFNVCIFGKAQKIVKRSGAKKGDMSIIVTGPFGYTSIGLDMLLNKKRNSNVTSKALQAMLKPKPRINLELIVQDTLHHQWILVTDCLLLLMRWQYKAKRNLS